MPTIKEKLKKLEQLKKSKSVSSEDSKKIIDKLNILRKLKGLTPVAGGSEMLYAPVPQQATRNVQQPTTERQYTPIPQSDGPYTPLPKEDLNRYTQQQVTERPLERPSSSISVRQPMEQPRLSVARPTEQPQIDVARQPAPPEVSVAQPREVPKIEVISPKTNIDPSIKETIGRSLASFSLEIPNTLLTMSRASAEKGLEKDSFSNKIYNAILPEGLKKWRDETNKKISDFAIKNIGEITKQQEIAVAPIFDDNPKLSSLNEYVSLMTQGGASILLAVGTYLLTKKPTFTPLMRQFISASVLSSLESSDVYNEARDAGKSPSEALNIAGTSFTGTTLLEMVGIKFFTGKLGTGIFKQIVKQPFKSLTAIGIGATGETAQEVLQTYWQNLVNKIGFNPTQKIFEGTWETIVATFPSAGFATTAFNISNTVRTKLIKDISEKGNIDEKKATQVIDSMTEVVKEALNDTKESQTKVPTEANKTKAADLIDKKIKILETAQKTGRTTEQTAKNIEVLKRMQQTAGKPPVVTEAPVSPKTAPVEQVKPIKGKEGLTLEVVKQKEGEEPAPKTTISRTQLKQFYKNTPEFQENPVLTVEQKTITHTNDRGDPISSTGLVLSFKGKTQQFSIVPGALGLKTENLKIGDKITLDSKTLKIPGTNIRVVQRTSGGTGIYASKGGQSIGTFEKRTSQDTAPFKLYEEGYRLVKKYAKLVSEKYVPRGTAGVTYPSQDIAIQSLNKISTVIHELAHVLDKGGLITDAIDTNVKTRSIFDRNVSRDLTKIYTEFYPGGKKTHPLRKRMVEGFATLLQKYAEQPSLIKIQYPSLVKEFLTEGGNFYKPVIGELLADVNDIVTRYQGLTSIQKIGSIVMHKAPTVDKKSFMHKGDNLRWQMADDIWPAEKLAKVAGVDFTKDDPSLFLRFHRSIFNLYNNNITPSSKGNHRGYRHLNTDGNLVEISKENIGDLTKALKKNELLEFYDFYLVARDTYFNYERLNELKNSNIKDPEVKEELRKLATVLLKNGITEDVAKDAYQQNKERFKDYDILFDKFTDAQLKALYDVEYITPEQYQKMMSRKGYAPFKREFLDEFIRGEITPEIISVGKNSISKYSSLIERTGSEKTIISPIYSLTVNELAVMKTVNKQNIANKFYKMKDAIESSLPGVFKEIPVEAVPDAQGRMTFPQEKDPNIIMARHNFKRKALLVDEYTAKMLNNVFDYKSVHMLLRLSKTFSRIFTKGTTGFYGPFSLVNVPVDALSHFGQSKNKVIPLVTLAKQLADAISKKDPEIGLYVKEYLLMGGHLQTVARSMDLDPDKSAKLISGELTKMQKTIKFLDKGGNFLSLPSVGSEYLSRLAEFVKSRQNGKPAIVALEEAALATGPFGHIGYLGGSTGQAFMRSFPYLNAQVQIADLYARSAKDPKTRNRFIFQEIMLSAIAVSQFLLMMAVYRKAKEKGGEAWETAKKTVNAYKNLNVYDKNNYLTSFKLKDGKFTRYRAPNLYMLPGSLINMMLAEKLLDDDSDISDYYETITEAVPAQFNPLLGIEWIGSLLPQIVRPLTETAFNFKTFPRGKEIESSYLKYKPSEDRYYDYTNDLAKELAKTKLAKSLDLSPIKIEHLLLGYFTRLIGMPTQKMFSGKEEWTESIKDAWTKSFSKEIYLFSGDTFNTFYKEKEKLDQYFPDIKDKWEAKDIKDNEYFEAKDKRKLYTDLAKDISDMKKIDRGGISIPISIDNTVNEIILLLHDGRIDAANKLYNKMNGGAMGSFIFKSLNLVEKK